MLLETTHLEREAEFEERVQQRLGLVHVLVVEHQRRRGCQAVQEDENAVHTSRAQGTEMQQAPTAIRATVLRGTCCFGSSKVVL